MEGRVNGFHFAIDVASIVEYSVLKINIVRENFVKFFPVGIPNQSNLFGFSLGSSGDVEHDISVVGVREEVTNAPVTDQVSSGLVVDGEVNNRVLTSRIDKRVCSSLVGPGQPQ